MPLAASNTETWTMAIVLTAGGVEGSLEAMSAALALASVTTSAWARCAVASMAPARSPGPAVIGQRVVTMACSPSRRSVRRVLLHPILDLRDGGAGALLVELAARSAAHTNGSDRVPACHDGHSADGVRDIGQRCLGHGRGGILGHP